MVKQSVIGTVQTRDEKVFHEKLLHFWNKSCVVMIQIEDNFVVFFTPRRKT